MNAGGCLVISPHLDDAVFSCGGWLSATPGTCVLTLFAGIPRDTAKSTEWDRRCGFASAGEAMRVRREEDCQALALLGAHPRWLSNCDHQYGEPCRTADLIDELRLVLAAARPSLVVLPFGLYHDDHIQAHEAAMAATGQEQVSTVWAYEDCLYRRKHGLLQERLGDMRQKSIRATPLLLPTRHGDSRKRQAVKAYASQWRAFGARGLEDTAAPECLWVLEH